MASPLWYPRLADGVRERLFAFVERILDARAFDPRHAGEYCEPR